MSDVGGSFISLLGDLEGRTSSSFGALVNVVCTVVGTGLLALPSSTADSGWIGVGLLLMLGLMAAYTSDLIVRMFHLLNGQGKPQGGSLATELPPRSSSQVAPAFEPERQARDYGDQGLVAAGAAHLLGDREAATYGDIGEAALGQVGRWMVNIQLYMTLLGVATIYHILGGLNLTKLFPQLLTISANIFWGNKDALAVLIIAAILWVHVFLKTLGEVAWISYINLAVTFTLDITVIAVALMYPPEKIYPSDFKVHTTFLNTDDMLRFGNSFSGFVFSFGVHAVVPAIYASMKHPEEFRSVNVLAFVIVLVLYLPMICFGYGVYGDEVGNPIYDTPCWHNLSVVTVIVWMITALVLMSYMIVINVPELALETSLGIDEKPRACLWRMLLRTGFLAVTACISIGIGVDKFGPTLNLVSSVTSTCTAYVFPSLFYLLIAKKVGHRVPVLEVVLNVVIIIGPIVGGVFGTIQALKDLGVISIGSTASTTATTTMMCLAV